MDGRHEWWADQGSAVGVGGQRNASGGCTHTDKPRKVFNISFMTAVLWCWLGRPG